MVTLDFFGFVCYWLQFILL